MYRCTTAHTDVRLDARLFAGVQHKPAPVSPGKVLPTRALIASGAFRRFSMFFCDYSRFEFGEESA
eukprot:1480239-Pyramimonas_sp.AAC.1